jgi:uncharacterized protein YqjF (DUF2071 family)
MSRMTRKNAAPFLTAEWRHLVMLNYEVDAALLSPLAARGTELDAWQGRTYVSLVGFLFLDTRIKGFPVPFHRNFEEVNLRFYVRRRAEGEERRGVVFIQELVPKRLLAAVARGVYNEKYRALPMSHDIRAEGQRRFIKYEWTASGATHGITARTSGEPVPLTPGSEAEFITEHYWGYTQQRDGGSLEYRVAHPSWRVFAETEASFQGNFAAVYGAEYRMLDGATPRSAFVAEGSAITVFSGERIA